MSTTDTTDIPPEVLRARMVDFVREQGYARTAAVEEAMRTVPRHLFVPTASIQTAYGDLAVSIKDAADGTMLSCASVPTVVAMMLDQLDVHPGMRILEIGAGTGYNAALLAHLTGSGGSVTTVDYDPEITTGARRNLDATGYDHVHVATRDGALGDPEHAPYDRIIVTVGAWDIPTTWRTQLAYGGRLVLPLRWRGQSESIAFTQHGDHLESDAVELCGFVPMIGQEGELTAHLDHDQQVALYWDVDQPIDPTALHGVLTTTKTSSWSGVTVGRYEPFHGVWVRLSAAEPGTCRIAADLAAVTSGLCTPATPSRSAALVEGDSLAYFSLRRFTDMTDDRAAELGAIGHGPKGADLAERLCEQIRSWGQDRTATSLITAYPAGTPEKHFLGTHTIRKSNSTLVISY